MAARKTYQRKTFYFDVSDKEQVDCFELLEKCQKRATKLITLALTEFYEKYDIRGLSAQDLKDFIRFYPVIKSATEKATKTMSVAMQIPQTDIMPEPKKAEEEDTSKASKEEVAKMEDALSAFFSSDYSD